MFVSYLCRLRNLTDFVRVTGTADALAEGFNLTDGRVEVTVPDVAPGSGYQVVRK